MLKLLESYGTQIRKLLLLLSSKVFVVEYLLKRDRSFYLSIYLSVVEYVHQE